MAFFFQELGNGVTTGALYSLVALGFSLVYRILKLLNFAHGDLYMVGRSVGFFVIQWFGGPSALTIPVPLLLLIMFVLAGGLGGGLGVAIERFAYRPRRDAPRIAPLITAIGVSFFLENAGLLLFGAQYRVYNTPAFINAGSGISIGSVTINSVQVLVLGMGLVLMVGVQDLVHRTELGEEVGAGGGERRGGRGEAGRQRELHDPHDVLPRLSAGRRGGGHGRAAVQSGDEHDRLHCRPQGVHRRGRRRHRVDPRCDARRPADRPGGVLHHRLHLLDLQQPAGVPSAHRRDAGAAQRAARPGPTPEGVSPVSLDSPPPAGPQVGSDEWVARQPHRREYLP